MDERLERLRNQMRAEAKAAAEKNGNGGGDKRYFRHFLAEPGGSTTVRFLDDHPDAKNEYFWREKQMFSWEFIDPETPGEKLKVVFPCRNMYEAKTCPVSKMISKEYETNEAAQKMWVNRTYLFQGFVRNTTIEEEEKPENPIRLFDFTKKLYLKIYEAITDIGEETALPSWPTNPTGGLNYILKTTLQGKHKDYSTSQFSQKPTDLTTDELAAIEQFGLYNLSEQLPKILSDEAYAMTVDMAEACLRGMPWDKKWEEHFKPWRKSDKKDSEDTSSSDSSKSDDAGEKPAEQKVVSDATKSLLAQLRR